MYGGSGVLLHHPNRTFNFSDVIIGGRDIQLRWEHIILYAFKFHVGMYVGDGKPPGLVKLEHCSHFTKEGHLGVVCYWCNCAELNFTRDPMEEWESLYIE